MIPSFGIPFVAPMLLVAVDLLFGLVCYALFFTVFVDRPHLPARALAAKVEFGVVLSLALAGLLLPFEGEHRRRCRPSLVTYGFRTDALTGPSLDPCAMTGQALVAFSMLSLLAVLFVVAAWWWSGDS